MAVALAFLLSNQEQQDLNRGCRRVFEYGPSAMLGSSDFFMNCPARFRMVAAEPCRLLRLSREALQRMTRQKPEVRKP